MKKTIAIIASALTLALALAGCAPSPQGGEPTAAPSQAPAVQTIPSADVYAALEGKYEFSAAAAMTEERLQETYGVDLSLCEDYVVMEPMMNVKTAETAIFRLKNAEDAAAFEEACSKRAEAVAKNFERYLQDQYEIAQNPVIKTIGNYVVMIINEEAAAMMATVEETLTAQ